ncbi:hypothetical protein C2857_004914 [Epichloe festucae Fl1]|uniref:DNA repair metallo-beta-lactamase domain-containing protein n=1 Tax=Epichloe festucae (strain Fl1) TaxID=877507 RepID=A0A7S9KSI9_EPIFF|nr:hypothetical protein C2857_004914 [Epichloe festucae Fl1]
MPAATKSNRSVTPRKPTSAISLTRKPAKPNASILSFFQKTQRPEDSLFVGATIGAVPKDDDIYHRDDEHRFNESASPNKKRRLSQESSTCQENGDAVVVQKSLIVPAEDIKRDKTAKPRLNVPFVIDSESEDEDQDVDQGERTDNGTGKLNQVPAQSCDQDSPNPASAKYSKPDDSSVLHPSPKRKAVPDFNNRKDSVYDQFSDLENLDETDGLDLDAFEGEEMRERRFMREQARLEAEEAGTALMEDFGDDPFQDDSAAAECCPICNGSLKNISMDEATRHVNSCLDGIPIPLPSDVDHEKSASPPVEVEAAEMSKRFARAAVPRPGQANPFELSNDNDNDNDNSESSKSKESKKSAFSKLMSNKAEDSAWAVAAAAENASRGRPAYERTCPFYKIIPGFNICVDAFRYGAVKGCEAYFLSHFHSDHYIGLTANWMHGPIYCSKVTGSLVKQQLRTAAKWVVALEFEKSYDIPGTGGATVTMIPANHCPGSSLFLFQKPAEKGTSRRGKRILHCGDFRACPAHVKHPLLKPEIKDLATGKLSQQVIDICYLDTTYLNPKYSFPPQDDVIKACADLCASLSPNPDSKDGLWEKNTKEEGTQAVSKYFQSTKQSDEKAEEKQVKLGQRLLVICGTYSIGKERICIAIAKALKTKIFANPGKMRICKQLDDPELAALLTTNPVEAQVHMQSLMEIRAETLQEYLNGYKPHFSRIVGFRPTGWTFRPANGKQISANTSPSTISTQQLLHGKVWRTRFAYKDFVAQRGSTKEAMCFGVPYSEHSSFRELTMFIMSLRIEKVIPTVNIGSEQSRKRMKAWLDRWSSERRRGGPARPLVEGEDDPDDAKTSLWEDKSGTGGGVWW